MVGVLFDISFLVPSTAVEVEKDGGESWASGAAFLLGKGKLRYSSGAKAGERGNDVLVAAFEARRFD